MNKRLYYIITITNRVMGSKHFLDFYRAFGAPVVFSALGRGTASDDVLSYLGLEATEKSVLFSVVTPQIKDVLMRELVDTMHIDRPGMSVRRGDERISLSSTEFRLLEAFLDRPGRVLSRAQLLDIVWGDTDWGDPHVVDVNIQRLRAKVGASHIVTVRGAGYKLARE